MHKGRDTNKDRGLSNVHSPIFVGISLKRQCNQFPFFDRGDSPGCVVWGLLQTSLRRGLSVNSHSLKPCYPWVGFSLKVGDTAFSERCSCSKHCLRMCPEKTTAG